MLLLETMSRQRITAVYTTNNEGIFIESRYQESRPMRTSEISPTVRTMWSASEVSTEDP